jgi:ATP-binding cassette, subfamily B (MDR/TAP), member 7
LSISKILLKGMPKDTAEATSILATQAKAEQTKTVKPAASPKDKEKDGLLSERIVSATEQRKADWAIIREMGKYLWPKVFNLSIFGTLLILTG